MGRPSKLTPKQWDAVDRRLLEGEPCRSLAAEYGIAESAIRKRFSAHKQIKAVANQLVSAEAALHSLPVSAQISARTLADELKEISTHLAGAARFGAATAHRLSGIAHGKVAMIDDAAPLSDQSLSELKGIDALTRMANNSAEIGINLLRANKEHVDDMNKRGASGDPIAELMASINGTALPIAK
jgi:hypothetical protein